VSVARTTSPKAVAPKTPKSAEPPATRGGFAVGARVAVKMEPSQHKGMTHKRFQGLTGTVRAKQGEAFVLDVMHGNMAKTLVVRAEHLIPIQ